MDSAYIFNFQQFHASKVPYFPFVTMEEVSLWEVNVLISINAYCFPFIVVVFSLLFLAVPVIPIVVLIQNCSSSDYT